jgi:hypothetical protein
MKHLTWALMLISVMFAGGVSAKPWNGIVPCSTSRLEVERTLGKGIDQGDEPFGSYRYKNSRIHIWYSRPFENLPLKDIVRRVEVGLDDSNPIRLTAYSRTLGNFPRGFLRREADAKVTHVGFLAYYTNQEEGFEMTVQKDDEDVEIVTRLAYYAPGGSCPKASLSD